jgi:ribonuclease Z
MDLRSSGCYNIRVYWRAIPAAFLWFPMRLILLGTTGYHPNERRQTLCLLLPECGVMLDAGTAVFRAGEYLTTPELDIFITHAHLDHVVGLSYLFSVNQAHPLKRITLHGLPENLRAVEEHLFAPALFPVRPPFETEPLAESVALAGGGRLTHFPLKHRGGSLGYRLDWPGHSMAYVTDTSAEVDADYVAKIRGGDLLVHECYCADARADWAAKTGHSHTTPVAQVARAAGVKKLVLVHFDPCTTAADPIGLATARAIFSETIVGEDRMELEF